MSDIGFQGIVVGLIALAMLAIALLGLVVEGVVLWRRRRAQRSGKGFLIGPVVYAVAGGVLFAVAETGSVDARGFWDNWSWLVALGALIPWIAAHLSRGNQSAGDAP